MKNATLSNNQAFANVPNVNKVYVAEHLCEYEK